MNAARTARTVSMIELCPRDRSAVNGRSIAERCPLWVTSRHCRRSLVGLSSGSNSIQASIRNRVRQIRNFSG
jgi:hypothetical protein